MISKTRDSYAFYNQIDAFLSFLDATLVKYLPGEFGKGTMNAQFGKHNISIFLVFKHIFKT